MRQRTVWAATAAGMAIAATVVAQALAHGGATGIVKQRMDLMDSIGNATKSLADMFKGKQPYDPVRVKQAAAQIEQHSGARLTKLFPEGSLQEPSEAKPEIWQDWQAFETMAQQLETYSDALEKAAERPRRGRGQDTRGEGGSMMMGSGNAMMSARGMMTGAGNAMMGARDMMTGGRRAARTDAGRLAEMSPDDLFREVAQTCNACHTRFRIEK